MKTRVLTTYKVKWPRRDAASDILGRYALKVTDDEEYKRDKISFEITAVKIREKRSGMFSVAFQVSSFTKTFDLRALERLFDVSLQREIPDASRSFFSYLQVDLRQWIIGRCHRKNKSEQKMDIEHFLNVNYEGSLQDLLIDVAAMKFCLFCEELLLLLSVNSFEYTSLG